MRTILAGLCWCCAVHAVQAQVISGGDFQRYLTPGYHSPSGGEPFSHRYGYSTGMSSFYFGGNGWQLGYLEYLDRIDRAQKFGYHVPFDLRYEFPTNPNQHAVAAPAQNAVSGPVQNAVVTETVGEPPPPTTRRVGLGLGFGLFRWR